MWGTLQISRPLRTYTVTTVHDDEPLVIEASGFKIVGGFIQFIDESDMNVGSKLVVAYNNDYIISMR